jgi:hypothetical protein
VTSSPASSRFCCCSSPQVWRRRFARTGAGDNGRAILNARSGAQSSPNFRRRLSEDSKRFYYGDRPIDKDLIVAVRVLINGAPIAAYVSKRHAAQAAREATSFDDRPEGIARDRWDVAVETVVGAILIECGAIRERVSQELARSIFDAIRNDLENRDR